VHIPNSVEPNILARRFIAHTGQSPMNYPTELYLNKLGSMAGLLP